MQSFSKPNSKSKRAKTILDRLSESKVTNLAKQNSKMKEELSKAGSLLQ
jgi:hypothetical protein